MAPRLILLAGLLASASTVATAETLTVAHNGGIVGAAMRDVFFKPFAAQTGHTIHDDSFNQELAKIRTQVETKNLQWDVVSVTAINEATGCDEGLLEKIDWSQALDPKDFEEVGGFGKCGLPNNFVSGGLTYDSAVIPDDKAPKTWADFWDVKKYPGKRGMLYRAEQTLEVALMADGVQPKDVMSVLAAPGGVDRAFRKLTELKPHIKWWKSGDESMQNILTGEVVMTFAWNGRVANANRSNNRKLKMVFGAGHVSGSQYIAVMRGTPKKNVAVDLLRYSSAPQTQADYARRIDYAPANAKGYALLSDAERPLLPSGHMHLASLQSGQLYLDFWLNNGDALLLCEEGLLEKIDWKAHVDEKPFKDIGGFGECGAPYLVSPGGLVYDAAKFPGDKAPKSWADFWDVKKYPGKRGLMYQPDQTLEIALMADGVAPIDVPKVLAGPGGVDRAFRKLAEIKPHVKWWRSGDESMQLVLTGEVDLVYAWQGRVNIAARTNNRDLKIVWPAGYTSALIYFGVMKGSPRKEEAIKLVKYQLAATPQARYAEIMGYPPANADAYPMLSAEKRANLPGEHSDKGMMQAGSLYINFWLDNGDSIRQRFATFVAQ